LGESECRGEIEEQARPLWYFFNTAGVCGRCASTVSGKQFAQPRCGRDGGLQDGGPLTDRQHVSAERSAEGASALGVRRGGLKKNVGDHSARLNDPNGPSVRSGGAAFRITIHPGARGKSQRLPVRRGKEKSLRFWKVRRRRWGRASYWSLIVHPLFATRTPPARFARRRGPVAARAETLKRKYSRLAGDEVESRHGQSTPSSGSLRPLGANLAFSSENCGGPRTGRLTRAGRGGEACRNQLEKRKGARC